VERALVVMAKEPSPGGAKTRLSPPLTATEAAALYHCFLLDTLELIRHVASAQPIVAYAPEEARSFFRRLAPPGFGLIPQAGADLGERLDRVVVDCLHQGYAQVVIVASDSPTIPLPYLDQAFHELDDPAVDVVLGPCDDGGYYLVGLKRRCPALFREMAMSTATVLEETLARAEQEGLRVVCLPPWYDVDTFEDLDRLKQELGDQPEHPAHHTRAFLMDSHCII
jgi:rSAM/selenodomain-associated transferase 1